MSEPRLCVILPTTGRPSLEAAIGSVVEAGATGIDWLYIVPDGNESLRLASSAIDQARRYLPCPVWTNTLVEPSNDVGGTPRNLAIDDVLGQYTADQPYHFLFLDDDDAWAPGAFEMIRERLREQPDIPHLFRMQGPPHGVLWRGPVLELGNVGGPMFVCPAVPGKVGRWDGKRGQDFRFMVETCQLHDDQLEWHRDIIYFVRPHEWREAA